MFWRYQLESCIIYKKIEDNQVLEDKTIVKNHDQWICFYDILSKGKKNDHVFHIACMTYINKHYDEGQRGEGNEHQKSVVSYANFS